MSALTDNDRGVKLSTREFKELRRQLQRKRYLKIELCDRLLKYFAIITCRSNTKLAFAENYLFKTSDNEHHRKEVNL